MSLSKNISARINRLTKNNLKKFTPSLQVAVILNGKVQSEIKLGQKATYFDLASLTKPIFCVSKIMELEKRGKLKLTDKVSKHWPEFPHRGVTLGQLLTHSAGFADWSPYYKKLKKIKNSANKRKALEELLLKEKRSSRKESLYSDIDFLILSVVLERISKKNLQMQWKELSSKLKIKRIHFCANNKPVYSKKLYAPTEKCPWRKRHLRGEVHDDNTWALGGVSTHAGLFGKIEDLTKYALLLRKAYLSGSSLAGKSQARRFLKRSVSKARGDWAMGFMMPSSKNSSAGKYFSANSVGHTGFTGTSIWFDPKRDLIVLILSNRVCPSRKNLKFRKLRPLIHDAIVEELIDSQLCTW